MFTIKPENPTNTPPAGAADETLAQLSDCLSRLGWLQAAAAARSGDLNQAEAILQARSRQQPTPENLDLLARVLAQQGRLTEAEQAWKRVLHISPQHANARAGLERIERLQSHGARRRLNFTPVLFGLAVLMLAGLSGLLLQRQAQLNQTMRILSSAVAEIKSEPAAPAAAAPIQTVPSISSEEVIAGLAPELERSQQNIAQNIQANRSDIQALSTQVSELRAAQNATTAPVNVTLDVPGVQSTPAGQDLYLVFDEGLFVYDTVFSETAPQVLTELAGQLAGELARRPGEVEIQIYGFVDSQEKEARNLGLQRAFTVMTYLYENTQIPKEWMSVRASDSLAQPYSNQSWETRMRNRTVMLVLHPINRCCSAGK
jgi:flagellar motor protein MotB